MARRTVTEVYNRQVDHEKDDRREFKLINTKLNSIMPKVEQMHDYIIRQKAIDGIQNEAKKSGSISITPEVWNIIKWLIIIIVGFVGYRIASGS